MKDRCALCGRQVVLVRDLGPPVNLDRYRLHHVARWRDLLHTPRPRPEWIASL